MKKVYIASGIALFGVFVLWFALTLVDNPTAKTESHPSSTPSPAVQHEAASTQLPVVAPQPEAPIQPDQRLVELKKKYPRSTEEEIAGALRQGIRLERLEQAPPGAVNLKLVTTAFAQFKQAFGAYPEGDNIKMAKALLGENPKHTVFLDNYKERFTDSSGALADSWKTPLLIEAKDSDQLSIRSAGPDRIFWNDDDVVLH